MLVRCRSLEALGIILHL